MTDMYILLIAFIIAILFIFSSYKDKSSDYFDPTSAMVLLFALTFSGYFNGLSWFHISPDTSVILLGVGLLFEVTKPMLIKQGFDKLWILSIVVTLSLLSISSMSTIIHKNLAEYDKKYIESVNTNLTSNSALKLAESKTNPYVLSDALKGYSDGELIAKIIELKSLQGEPSNVYRKANNYYAKYLKDTIWKLTKNCTNESSEYFIQRDVCKNILLYSAELDTRKNSVAWEAKHQDTFNTIHKNQNSEVVTQNEWVQLVVRVMNFFDHDVFVGTPTTLEDVTKLQDASTLASMILANIMAIILEVILITSANFTFHKSTSSKGIISTMKGILNKHSSVVELVSPNLQPISTYVPLHEYLQELSPSDYRMIYEKFFRSTLHSTVKTLDVVVTLLKMGIPYEEIFYSQAKAKKILKESGFRITAEDTKNVKNILDKIFLRTIGKRSYWLPKDEIIRNLNDIGIRVED